MKTETHGDFVLKPKPVLKPPPTVKKLSLKQLFAREKTPRKSRKSK